MRGRVRSAAGRSTTTAVAVALLATTGLAAAPAGHDRPAAAPPRCTTPASPDGLEPPCNPYLAPTLWSANHRNAYAQASSPAPGPVGPPEEIDVDHAGVVGDPIVVTFSPPYPDGKRVVWGSTVGPTGEVFKLDPTDFSIIDEYRPQTEDGEAPQEPGMSGAYNVLDRDGHLIVGRKQALEVYGDAVAGERTSDVARLDRFDLPDAAFCRPGSNESLIGINMTYDGHVAFATSLGNVGVVPRDPAKMDADHLVVHRINGAACDDADIGTDQLEQVANTIATDEDGGIYVITSDAMHRIDWDGTTLTDAWTTPYTSDRTSDGSLGPGSGASPTLMGTRPGDDRFVVIYDDAQVFHLELLWRGKIPADWEGLPGEPRRVACKVPVDFGRDDGEAFSEQSPLVRGYATVLVSDRMQADPLWSHVPSRAYGWAQLAGGTPGNEPRGAARIDWDPTTRTCHTVWENPDVAIPNTIPTMSAATNMMYAVGVENGTWTLLGVDWDTGKVRLSVPTAAVPTENSLWAATTVGPDGAVYSGTFGGVTRWQQCAPDAETCGRRPDLVEHLVGDPTDVSVP